MRWKRKGRNVRWPNRFSWFLKRLRHMISHGINDFKNLLGDSVSKPITPSSKLIFKSGFGEGVAILPMDAPYNRLATNQGIEGSDVLGHSWPIDLRSPTKSKFHHIINNVPGATPVPDLNDYFDTHIETVTGRNGTPTEALYQSLLQGASATSQSWYEIYYDTPSAVSDENTYVSYWMKFQDNLLETMVAPEWRSVFFWKTENTDYRVEAYVYRNTNNNGNPYFYIHGDKFKTISGNYEKDWSEFSYDIPVPIGEWFKMEFFWHRSTGADGRVYWAVNGELVADRFGPNYGDYNNSINRISPFGLYTSPTAYPVYQWVDDLEICDDFKNESQ